MQRMTTFCRRISSQVWGNLTMHQISSNHCQSRVSPNAACLLRLKYSSTAETGEQAQTTQQFSGYIPVEELQFSYSRSSGPGGQNVNKVNTKVEIRFHVPSASWISEDIKGKLMEMERNRITKDGFLVLTSDRTRKQLLNQADALDRIRSIVFKAAFQPRGLTEQESQLKDKRIAKAKDQALRERRQNSMKKQSRGSV